MKRLLTAILRLSRRSVFGAVEAVRLAFLSIWGNRARSLLAISGVIVGIITVVLVASVLANLRNQVALLFRELGTENVFAFHLTGDPYSDPTEAERNRRPLKASFAEELERRGNAIREVGVQLIVPNVVDGLALTARSGGNESDSILVEGVSANFFDVVGAEFRRGRSFTDLEERAAARVAIIGPSIARALYGRRSPLGQTLILAGERYFVVGELAPRRGGFFGENRQDSVLAIPSRTAQRRFVTADRIVLYMRSKPGLLEETQEQSEVILRQLRGLGPREPSDFTLSTAESIIRTFDQLSAQIGLATIGLAAVSLIIGGIGIANVMIISVTERTREIGVRLAIGARRREVLAQFLIEAGVLSGVGGITGVTLTMVIGLSLKLVLTGFSAVPPTWAITAGVGASLAIGILAGYWPARRASYLDPVEALRHE
jgi:putative ABC transport system permease protein